MDIEKTITHKNMPGRNPNADEIQYYIGLLITKNDIIFTYNVKAIKLPQIDLPSGGGTKVTLAAWGKNLLVRIEQVMYFAFHSF